MMTEIPYGYCHCGCGQKTSISPVNVSTRGLIKGVPLRFVNHHGRVTHGHCRTWTGAYKAWRGMMARCYSAGTTGYTNYGGRGITVCDRWHRFQDFYADMGDRPIGKSLDRIDNEKNYEPTNCRWATPKEQANNTRQNRRIEYLGRTFTLSGLADYTGHHRGTLKNRLRLGWSIERAVLTPAGKRRRNHWIEYLGRTFSLSELAEYTNRPRGTLATRLRLGWPIERAVLTPVRTHGPKEQP